MKNKILLSIFMLILLTSFASALDNNLGVTYGASTTFSTTDDGPYQSFVVNAPNKTITSVEFGVSPGINANSFYIKNSTGTMAIFNNVMTNGNSSNISFNLTMGITYQMWFNTTTGTKYNATYNDATAGYPVSNTDINFTGAYYFASTPNKAKVLLRIRTANLTSNPPPPAVPTISFTTPPTPTNGTTFYLKNESLIINATISSGIFDINLVIYNSTGSAIKGYCTGCSVVPPTIYTVLSASPTNSLQATINTTLQNLTIGNYYYNVTFSNATYNNRTETRTLFIYNLTPKGINNPSDGQILASQFFNFTWNATTTTPTGTGVTISAYNVSLRNSDSSLNRSIVSTSNSSFLYNLHLQNLSLGSYGLRVESIDSNGNIVYQQNLFNYTKDANLTITLVNAYNGSSIVSNGSLTLVNNLTGLTENFNVINGRASFDIVKNITYLLTFNVSGYAITNTSYITNTSTFQTANMSLYTNNSVYIYIYDETTGNQIYSNVTVTFTGLTTSVYTTNTSELFVSNLRDGNWSVSFYGTNYSLKTYLITVGAQSFQTLNAFLTDSSNAVIFTIKDFDSSLLLEGASISQYRRINASWTLIDTRTSDITARAQFYYVPTVEYQFIVSLANYQSESFELNPILFSSYDIRLQKTTTLNPSNTPSGTGISVTYNPVIFYNNLTNNFTWNIVSPIGSLVNYNLNLRYPSGNQSFSGSNAIGEQINTNFVINGANLTSQVLIGYCYEITTSGLYCFNYSYNIISVTANNTYIGNSNNSYGLGTWERVLIMTLIVIVVTAVAYAFAGLIVGLAITLFLYLYFYYIGFVPLWSIAIPLFFGVQYILFSGGKR